MNHEPSHRPSASNATSNDSAINASGDFPACDEVDVALDRLSNFTLYLIVDAVQTPSLRVFLNQTTADPQVRRILLARAAGNACSNATMMGRATWLASANSQIAESEKEALYAAILIARVGAMIEVGARQQRPAGACAHALHRRWRYLLEAALRCLATSDAANCMVIRSALGMEPAQDEKRCARLQTAVDLAWIQATSRGVKRPLPPSRSSTLALE